MQEFASWDRCAQLGGFPSHSIPQDRACSYVRSAFEALSTAKADEVVLAPSSTGGPIAASGLTLGEHGGEDDERLVDRVWDEVAAAVSLPNRY
jgi:hypothetical protein